MTTRILMNLISFATGTLVAVVAAPTLASELDNPALTVNQHVFRAQDLPGTVVVRVNTKGEASVLESQERLNQDSGTVAAIHSKHFRAIDSAGVAELDRVSSSSSWFALYNPGYQWTPTYYYSGYNYSFWNCWSYVFAGFNYYWYRF